MSKCLLIGGTGRSGSNKLKEVLSQHLKCCSLFFEPRYLLDPDGIIDFYESIDNWSPYNIDFKLRRLFKLLDRLGEKSRTDQLFQLVYKLFGFQKQRFTPPRYHHWELNAHLPGFKERVAKLKVDLGVFEFDSYWVGSESFEKANKSLFSPFTSKEEIREILVQFIDANISSVLEKSGKEVYLDDSTFNILHANSLRELMPHSNLIHIYRQPQDVIASLGKQKWAPSELSETIKWYKSTLQRWEHVKAKLPKDYYLEIKFEDFINDFEATMNIISSFSGVDFNDINNTVDLSKHNIGRWENDFTNVEKKLLDRELRAEIKSLNY